MPKTTTKKTAREKIAYAKQVLKAGTTRTADIQKAVKAKFGTGMNFKDLGKVFPKKRGRKPAARRGPGRPRNKRGPGRPPKARRGRPAGGDWLLMVGDEGEHFASRARLQQRVAEVVGDGIPQEEIAVYERAKVTMTVKTVVTV